MRKDSNGLLTITISKTDLEMLEFISKYYGISKTKIVVNCLRSSKTLSKMWKSIEYDKLDTTDKKYYVKLVKENYFYEDLSDLKTLDQNILLRLTQFEQEQVDEIQTTLNNNPKLKRFINVL